MKILVTGGTAFVSRYTAEWFLKRGDDVYVLNRGTKPQSHGVKLICADRRALGDELRGMTFDAVIDVCAYTGEHVTHLLDALGDFGCYVLISSSAVYPESNAQPFCEDQPVGPNSIWGTYGMGKIAAEQTLLSRTEKAWILRPPYLYGPMQNVYREGFAFDCAAQGRPFVLPGDGDMPLQFFHVRDLCRMIEKIMLKRPEQRIINVGNPETVSIAEFVRLCYEVMGVPLRCVHERTGIEQRKYFCFHDYAYRLDVRYQQTLLPLLTPLRTGLMESLVWYQAHPEAVNKHDYIAFIDNNILK